MYTVTYDIDWGLRGERKKVTLYFREHPNPNQIEAAFAKHGYNLREDWAVCVGMIKVHSIEFEDD